MIQGSVSFQPGGEGDWVDAVQNRPLTSGDNIWADQNARAEMHIGSTAIRLNSETSMTILELDDRTTQLKLSQGSIILRVRHVDDGDTYEVDTPNLAFDIQRTGEYRIDVSGDGNQTDVSVFSGRGEVTGGGYS
jgi:ferric-dicitrate binding protein FerR (iron transport regulator)